PQASFLCMLLDPPPATLFPYTTLFRSRRLLDRERPAARLRDAKLRHDSGQPRGKGFEIALHRRTQRGVDRRCAGPLVLAELRQQDRKSTRLNSSHRTISYAVFCLKKKM